jgi:hypothetical protein
MDGAAEDNTQSPRRVARGRASERPPAARASEDAHRRLRRRRPQVFRHVLQRDLRQGPASRLPKERTIVRLAALLPPYLAFARTGLEVDRERGLTEL